MATAGGPNEVVSTEGLAGPESNRGGVTGEEPGMLARWSNAAKITRNRWFWLAAVPVAALAVAVMIVIMATLGGSQGSARETVTSSPEPGFSGEIEMSGFGGDGAMSSMSGISVTDTADQSITTKFFSQAASAPAATAAPSFRDEDVGPGSILAFAERQIISQGSLFVEVEDVSQAVAQVRVIAESTGGFVEQLSSSGVDDGRHATLTLRVPQSEFFAAFDRIKLLGKVASENAGSEDVSEQFIDLEARLQSAQREEESLLSLLGRAQQVSDVLTIERELFRVRTELERVQGQLNFLERRVALATITVSLSGPQVRLNQPPSGFISVETNRVSVSVDEVKLLISGVGGELDQVRTSVGDGIERANLSARVFAKDFEQVVASVEGQGKVTIKELDEGSRFPDGQDDDTGSPRSRVGIAFTSPEDSGAPTGLLVGAPLGGVALAALLGLLFYVTYRAGRRRSSS